METDNERLNAIVDGRPDWEVDAGNTKDHWLEVVEKLDGRVYYRASVKWDGCIHYNKYHNGGEGDEDSGDYIHLCDLDEEIQRLQRLRKMAEAHFVNHWYEEWKPAARKTKESAREEGKRDRTPERAHR